MKKILLGFCLLLTIFCQFNDVKSTNLDPIEKYPHNEVFVNDVFYLYWKHDDQEIKFEIHYRNTSKWILFGIQSNNFSDVITGWINDDGISFFL